MYLNLLLEKPHLVEYPALFVWFKNKFSIKMAQSQRFEAWNVFLIYTVPSLICVLVFVPHTS